MTPIPLNDLQIAFSTANSTFAVAGRFFKGMPKDKGAFDSAVKTQLGAFFTAATNLALSTELYLKALAIGTKTKVLHTHNLLKLFNALPAFHQDAVEARYDASLKLFEPTEPVVFTLRITATPIRPAQKDWDAALPPVAHDIRSVLRSEKDAFETWRYMFESGSSSGKMAYRFEFKRLGLIATLLGLHIKALMLPPT